MRPYYRILLKERFLQKINNLQAPELRSLMAYATKIGNNTKAHEENTL